MQIFPLILCLLFQIIANVRSQATICCYWSCSNYVPYYIVGLSHSTTDSPRLVESSTTFGDIQLERLGNIFDAPLVCAAGEHFVGGRCRKILEF